MTRRKKLTDDPGIAWALGIIGLAAMVLVGWIGADVVNWLADLLAP